MKLKILSLWVLAGLAGPSAVTAASLSITNFISAPQIISAWGGAGSEQIILKSDGTVWDWGWNLFGQLGDGATNNADVPLQVHGPGGQGFLTNITAIMGGETHNFALKTDGTVWAWGRNIFGEVGDGSTNWGGVSSICPLPVQVAGLTSVVSLGGRGYHNLAVKSDGTVWAWGDNNYGELGINSFTFGTNVAVQVQGVTNPVMVTAGSFYSLALMPDGTVRAWGDNTYGECGDGTTNNRALPVTVIGLSNVVYISGGWDTALAVESDGSAWAWGLDTSGEVGIGTVQASVTLPAQITTLSNVVALSGGDYHCQARLANGTVWEWGANVWGTLGNGMTDNVAHPFPVQVPGISNIVISACRDYHDICLQSDGTVWVWGDNRFGGCGDFTGSNVVSPRVMPGLGSASPIDNISISWPSRGWLLQKSSDVASTNWKASGYFPADNGINKTVTLQPGPDQFFRLIHQ